MPSSPPANFSVDDVIVAPARAPGGASSPREAEALLKISQVLAARPQAAVQRLIELAMESTGAHSAGVSLEDSEDGKPVFRWIATAGEYARYLGETMPRHFSPCGTVLDRGRTLVMHHPERCFLYMQQLHAPVRNGLLTPFPRKGRLVGTVWVVSHTDAKTFHAGDVRRVEKLTTFATAILDTLKPSAPA